MTLSRTKQSIADMTSENFGQLDQMVKFARDNGFDFKTEIPSDTSLVINNPVGIGNDSNKEAIKVQGLEFNNDYVSSETPIPPVDVKNGYLYNWHAASDANFFPSGWGLPSDAELTTLTTFLGGTGAAGGKMKETGLDFWNTPNTGATNESGFTARGTGTRSPLGAFSAIKVFNYLWSATVDFGINSFIRILVNSTASIIVSSADQKFGATVRGLYNGIGTPPEIIQDIDGNAYDTIQIGAQYWTVQNWKATKLNNGTLIPNVTDNTAWSNLSTLGRCAYDNDEENV